MPLCRTCMFLGVLLWSTLADAGVRVLAMDRLAGSGAAALEPGDQIVAIRSPAGEWRPQRLLDWLVFEFDQLPRGPAELTVLRGAQNLSIAIEDGRQRVLVEASADVALGAGERAEDQALVLLLRAIYAEQGEQLAARLDALPPADPEASAEHALARRLVEADALQRLTRLPDAIAQLEPVTAGTPRSPMQALAQARLGWAKSFRGGAPTEAQAHLAAADAAYAQLAPASASAVDVQRMRWQVDAMAAPQGVAPLWARVQSALETDTRCSDCLARVRALVGQATVANLADQPEAAIGVSQQALRLLDQIPDAPVQDRFGALNTLGYAELVLDRLDAALATHTRLLAVARSPRGNPRNLVTALQRTGLLQQAYGQTSEAQATLSEALALAQRLQPGSLAEYNPRLQLARVHLDLGDYAAAREEYLRARTLLDANGQHVMGYAFLQFDLGRLEADLGDLPAAEREIRRGLEVAVATNPDGVATSQGWTQLAVVLTRAGRHEDAEAALDAADQINQKQPPDCGCRVVAASERAWLELERGHPERAAQLLDQVHAEPHASSLYQRADLLYARAEAARRLGQYQRASDWLQEVIATRTRYAPYQPQLAQAWFALGEAERALAHPEAARAAWCKAADVLDLSSARVGGDSLAVAQFRSQFVQIYQRCMDAEFERGEPEAAWRVLERSRARAFLYALEQRHPEGSGNAALNEWLSLRKRMTTLMTSLAEPALAEAKALALEQQLRGASDSLQQQRNAVAAQDPIWAQVLDPAAVRLKDVQAVLPRGAALLMYSLREDHSLLFVIDRKQLHSARLPIGRNAAARRVAELRELLARRDRRDLPALERQVEALYADLLGPAAPWIADRSLLMISPEGPLHDLPFALLRDGERGQYLIERAPLTLVDSGSALRALAQRGRASGRPALVVGAGGGGDVLAGSWRGAPPLPALPEADAEARTVAGLRGASTLLTGPEATESRVLAALRDSSMAHFAVHALVSTERPMESALVLASDPAQKGSAADGALQMWELLGRQVHAGAALVVLSACATARGAETVGEGLQGFTRSFQLVGADAVVASLWPVGDRPTRRLMEAFHRELLISDATPAQALRKAMLAMRQQDTDTSADPTRGVGAVKARQRGIHPYDWAAFQVYGLNR